MLTNIISKECPTFALSKSVLRLKLPFIVFKLYTRQAVEQLSIYFARSKFLVHCFVKYELDSAAKMDHCVDLIKVFQ